MRSFLSVVVLASVLLCVVVGDEKPHCVCVSPPQCEHRASLSPESEEESDGEEDYGGGLLSERFGAPADERNGDCSEGEICCPVKSSTKPHTIESGHEGHNQSPELPKVHEIRGCGARRFPDSEAKDVDLDLRISGGVKEDTFYGEAPWMARLIAGDEFICGAILINPEAVLTAAHCLKRIKDRPLLVEVGEWDTSSEEEPLLPQRSPASEIIPHPDFNQKNLKSDVALIFLKTPFRISEVVDTICTPEDVAEVDDKSCVAVGWGKSELSDTASLEVIMRKVSLPLIDRDVCEKKLRRTRLGPRFKLAKSFLCAGGNEEADTCEGDGGGPLYCPLKSDRNRFAVVGITAWGIDCGVGNPAVFASVPHHSTWIYSKIAEHLEKHQR